MRSADGSVIIRPNAYARKDSGSFYTPQELVDLIVDRTLKPLAEERLKAFENQAAALQNDRRPKAERHAELRKFDPAEAVLDLKVLDPAMGSGHFLVTAVDFLSDYISELIEYVPAVPAWLDGDYASPLVQRIERIRHDLLQRAAASNWVIDEAQLTDQAIIRRMVLKRCIYGVDKNRLTVELAKVSLWLHSFTVGAPLSFLDHHLRVGDSLIGVGVQDATGELHRLGGLFAGSAIAGAEAATAGMQRIEAMSDADVAEVRESASLFARVEETTADLRGLLDFLCGWRWMTAGMKTREKDRAEGQLVAALRDDAYSLLARGPDGMENPPDTAAWAGIYRIVAHRPRHCRPRRLSALGGRFSRRLAALAERPAGGRLRRRHRQPAVGPHQAAGSRVVRHPCSRSGAGAHRGCAAQRHPAAARRGRPVGRRVRRRQGARR